MNAALHHKVSQAKKAGNPLNQTDMHDVKQTPLTVQLFNLTTFITSTSLLSLCSHAGYALHNSACLPLFVHSEAYTS